MTGGQTFSETSQSVDADERSLEPSTKPTILCHAVFAALGVLLLVAAGFKTYQAYSEPMSRLGMLGALAQTCVEMCFGIWLVIGERTKGTWRVTMACFVVFAFVSGYKLLTGASSCGCFGVLRVNPAITLGMDMMAVAFLAICRTGVETVDESFSRRVFPGLASLAFVSSLLVTSVFFYGQSRFVQSDGMVTAAGDLVVLQPNSWIGEQWPLLDESGLETDLVVGEWDVLLFRHDCHVCHDVMLELQQSLSSQTEKPRIALIGIDLQKIDAQVAGLQELGCLLGFLPQDRDWFATTPLRLRLREGVCVSASVIEHWE